MKSSDQPVIVNTKAFPEQLRNAQRLETVAGHELTDNRPINNYSAEEGMAKVFEELKRAEIESKSNVLIAPHEGLWAGPAARFQSLVAAGEIQDMRLTPLQSGGLEAQFDTRDWLGWLQVAWEKIKNLSPYHPVPRPPNSVPETLPDYAEIAIAGDWGTALYGALHIKEAICKRQKKLDVLMHLGDIYYSGTHEEVQTRFLDHWPTEMAKVNRALNSNHEMYSGGFAYFQDILPKFNQSSAYFALQNKHWTLIGLDVAYIDHRIDSEQVSWLEEVIGQAGGRKVILFSHHQLYSQFESQGTSLLDNEGFNQILRSKRIFAWYWGHEHRCVLFGEPDKQFGLWGRCIGHGGMPESRAKTINLPRAAEKVFERADWRRVPAKTKSGLEIPFATVLEGPNQFIAGEENEFLPHGFAVLTFDGPKLIEQILDPKGAVIYEKALAS